MLHCSQLGSLTEGCSRTKIDTGNGATMGAPISQEIAFREFTPPNMRLYAAILEGKISVVCGLLQEERS